MEINNNLLDDKSWEFINSSQLSYKKNIEVGDSVSKAANNPFLRKGQHINNEALAFKSTSKP